jgi:hypothetical protein
VFSNLIAFFGALIGTAVFFLILLRIPHPLLPAHSDYRWSSCHPNRHTFSAGKFVFQAVIGLIGPIIREKAGRHYATLPGRLFRRALFLASTIRIAEGKFPSMLRPSSQAPVSNKYLSR